MKYQLLLLVLLQASFILGQQYWLDQPLDNLNPQDKRTFKARYWVNATYYQEGGPAFLYICGEATCKGLTDKSYALVLAQKFKGVAYALEHRYYGFSQPFGQGEDALSTKNLQYLTVENALQDLANFIYFAKNVSLGGISKDTPWVTIGGSYPGALSAWFRYKYPHLTVGALASSAVINAILDFPKFDQQIYLSTLKSGQECPNTIQSITNQMNTILSSGYSQSLNLKSLFNASNLSNAEFQWYIADFFVLQVQYGGREKLCDGLVGKQFEDQLQFIMENIGENTFQEYGSYYLKNASFNLDGARQWTYQTCAQLAYFQTPYTNLSQAMRPLSLNIEFYKELCQQSFGIDLWPDTDAVNLNLGGIDLTTTNIVFTNGGEDPWQHASLLQTKGDMVSFLMDCNQCAHCVELYPAKETDSEELNLVRKQQQDYIQKWISQHYQRINKIQQQESKFLGKVIKN